MIVVCRPRRTCGLLAAGSRSGPGAGMAYALLVSVVMYVKPGCPYCQAAREHLAEEGASVEERDATRNPDWKAELMGYTNNRGVVPTIVWEGSDEVQVGFPAGRG